MSDPQDDDGLPPRKGFLGAVNRRELAFVHWLIPPIETEEQAASALGYARRAGLIAGLVAISPIFLPEGLETMTGGPVFVLNDQALTNPIVLLQAALYGYIYFAGYRKLEVVAGALALFAASYLVWPMLAASQSWLALAVGLYIVRCFAIGLRSLRFFRRLDTEPHGPPEKPPTFRRR
ncbi:MAG: hypothetical protein HOH66_05755 [Rhodospirillaceae bacterium]|nr:hypothetical protein [Rhodospirillaceae bacterium]MBT6117353.1 hypothetical protein [Rhodospirillaceae bacterium]